MESKRLSTTECVFVKKFCLVNLLFRLSLYPGNTTHHMLTEHNIKDKSQQVNQIASLFNFYNLSDGIGRLFFALLKSNESHVAFRRSTSQHSTIEISTSQIKIPLCQ